MKNILYLLIGMLAFTACSDDSDPVLPQHKASVLADIAQKEYILLPEDKNNDLFTLNWTSTEQEDLLVGPPSYCIQIDTVGADFKSAITTILAQTPDHTVTLKVKDLNSILATVMMQKPEVEQSFEIRVITRFGLGNALIPSTASNVLTLKVTPYRMAGPALHLIGNMFTENSWNEKNYTFVMFRSSSEDVVETYTGKFAAGSGFKFIGDEQLNGWDGLYGGSDGTLSTSGGDIKDIATEGYYTLTANLKTLKYTITPYDASAAPTYVSIGLIGDFNSWGGDLVLTQASYDPHIWYADNVTFSDNGGAKFRANADWASSWGGDSFPYGGGSGNNINVTAGKYFVKFNDITGLYVFYAR